MIFNRLIVWEEKVLDEASIIEEAKLGDRNALNELLTSNYNIVKGYIIKMTGNPDTAQDIIQETMLRACLKISGFKPNAKFSTWLIVIATNVYKDMLRKNKIMQRADERLFSEENEAFKAFESKEECLEIMNILLDVPYKKRAAFILKHYYGYKHEEIAAILKCPVGTVKSRINSCIKYVNSEMEKRGLVVDE